MAAIIIICSVFLSLSYPATHIFWICSRIQSKESDRLFLGYCHSNERIYHSNIANWPDASAFNQRRLGPVQAFKSPEKTQMRDLALDRRDSLLAPLLAAAASSFGIGAAQAAGVDPTMTIVVPPDKIPWQPLYNFPPGAAEQAAMVGAIGEAGQYFVLIRWQPGFMSAPHWYETDRLCVVLSGTWYVASGEDFAPEKTVPAPAGSFVRRVARTPHYDGVIKSVKQPAVIAISGMGPIHYHLTDPSKPGWREV